jgi:DNA-binding GntR family transcriptional regulator
MVDQRRGAETSAYLRANQDFHFTIYRAADRPVTLRMVELLWMQCGPSLTSVVDNDRVMGRFEDNHAAILHALRSGDGDGAARAVAADITTTLENLVGAPVA